MKLIVKPGGVMILLGLIAGGWWFGFSHSNSTGANPSSAMDSTVLAAEKSTSLRGAGQDAKGTDVVPASPWTFYREGKASGESTPITSSPSGESIPGFHINVDACTSSPWNIGMTKPLGIAFPANETLTLHFWARADHVSVIDVAMQKNTPGFPTCFTKEYTIGTEWKEYVETIKTIEMANYESMLAIHAGHQKGWVEVAGVELDRPD